MNSEPTIISSKRPAPTETSAVKSLQPFRLAYMPNTVQGLLVPLKMLTPNVQISTMMPTSRTYFTSLSARSTFGLIFGRGSLSFVPMYQNKSPILPNEQRKPQKKRPIRAVIRSMETTSTICPVSAAAENVPPISAV